MKLRRHWQHWRSPSSTPHRWLVITELQQRDGCSCSRGTTRCVATLNELTRVNTITSAYLFATMSCTQHAMSGGRRANNKFFCMRKAVRNHSEKTPFTLTVVYLFAIFFIMLSFLPVYFKGWTNTNAFRVGTDRCYCVCITVLSRVNFRQLHLMCNIINNRMFFHLESGNNKGSPIVVPAFIILWLDIHVVNL